MRGTSKDEELTEFGEPERFDEDDHEGDFGPDWDSDDDPEMGDSKSSANSGECHRDDHSSEQDYILTLLYSCTVPNRIIL